MTAAITDAKLEASPKPASIWSRGSQYPPVDAQTARGPSAVDALVAVTTRQWAGPHEAASRHVRTSLPDA